jgi:hypothetical protein
MAQYARPRYRNNRRSCYREHAMLRERKPILPPYLKPIPHVACSFQDTSREGVLALVQPKHNISQAWKVLYTRLCPRSGSQWHILYYRLEYVRSP